MSDQNNSPTQVLPPSPGPDPQPNPQPPPIPPPIPPPAPLPPPPPGIGLRPTNISGGFQLNHLPSSSNKEDEHKEAEATKLCRRHFDNDGFHVSSKLLLSFYNSVSPVLQEGPSCGLAALCMAGQLLKSKDDDPRRLSLNEVRDAAFARGYTSRGEMFSAANMRQLAVELLHCDAELLNDGLDNNVRIMKHLMRGLPILVPYDADMNHHPCCKKGHKAHWAVLTGIVLVVASNMSNLLLGKFIQDETFHPLRHSEAGAETLDFDFGGCVANMFLYARQGKSNHPALWAYSDLMLSNDNLLELGPNRRNSLTPYLIPEEGVKGGLCRKVILLGNAN